MAHSTDSPRLDVNLSERATRSGGGWQLADTTSDSWAWIDVLTPDECDSIIDIGKQVGLFHGTTGGSDNDPRRNSSVAFIHPSETTGWVFRKLATAVTATNQFFGFDLTHMLEGIQFTEYRAPGQKYGWHVDAAPGMSTRKLSLTIQLTDPDDYDGGDLQLNPNGDIITLEKVRGRAFVFPSWTLHQVTPVTRGTRHSLVVWVTGPKFR
jgi:PKHD-type hydroxylase